MLISVASGKGGTGKTTLAVSLVLSLKDKSREVQFSDCAGWSFQAATLALTKGGL